MIIGIGIDSIEIDRFAHWHAKPRQSLERIFSPQEIDYCLSIPAKSAERFAARFACREALYKALPQKIPFLTLAKGVTVLNDPQGCPQIVLGPALEQKCSLNDQITIWLSITHTQIAATAFIILEKPLITAEF